MPAKHSRKWWTKVDWNLTNAEIARKEDISGYTVRKKRLELGVPSKRRGPPLGKYGIDVSKIDWTKPDAELARELKISHQAVWQHRQRLGKPVGVSRYKSGSVDWSALDWSKTNGALAREVGVGKNVVARQRKRWTLLPALSGAPRKFHGDFSQVDWTKRDGQLAVELGLARTTVNWYRKKLGHKTPPRPKRGPLALPSFDWTKSNCYLARTLHVSKRKVAECRKQAGAPPVPHLGRPRKLPVLQIRPKGRVKYVGCIVLVVSANLVPRVCVFSEAVGEENREPGPIASTKS